MNHHEQLFQQKFQIVTIIGYAMLSSILVYIGIAEFIARQNQPFEGFAPQPELAVLPYILFAISFSTFLAISFLKKTIRKVSAQDHQGDVESSVTKFFMKETNIAVMSYAMSESIALYGLILFLLSGDRTSLYLFTLFSFICFAIHFPRRSDWEERFHRLIAEN